MGTENGRKSLLSTLYEIAEVEAIWAIAYAESMDLQIELANGERREKVFLGGDYIVVKLVNPIVSRPGLFAKQAPKPKDDGE